MSSRLRLFAMLSVVVIAGCGLALWSLWPHPPEMAVAAGQTALPDGFVVPQLTGQARIGQAAFDVRCASCHGPAATGTDAGPPLVHRIYEPGHHGDGAFVAAALRGTRAHHWQFGDMPPVEGITVEEIEPIIAYVRSLQRANGIS